MTIRDIIIGTVASTIAALVVIKNVDAIVIYMYEKMDYWERIQQENYK